MFGAYGAPVDIVSHVCIYARPKHCLPCLDLHPIGPLVFEMQISKGMVKELWGSTDSCPLEEEAQIDEQFVPVSPEMSGNAGNVLPSIRPPSNSEAIDSAIHQGTFHRALNDVQFSIRQQHMLDIVGYGDGKGVYMGGEMA